MKKRVLFIDRDGTLIEEPKSDFQVDSLSKFKLLPNVVSALKKVVQLSDYELVMITNQDGLGTDSFPEADFWPLQNLLIDILSSEGVEFDEILIDRSFESENSPNRKPRTGMLQKYFSNEYDLENSWVIGDRLTDVELAKNLGAKSILIGDIDSSEADYTTNSWLRIQELLLLNIRQVQLSRKTNETKIDLDWKLDGSGQSSIQTGIGFYDHMLEQIAKHSGSDLVISCEGDLNVDEHHTIEDVAITMGLAFNQLLGDKKGIERYAFLLPVDEALSHIAIDCGGRPDLVWDVPLKRMDIGGIPTEMFKHFFKSFVLEARIGLNIKATGENEHHMIESVFKGFAKVIKQATKRSLDNYTIPSTKGSI